MEEPHQNGGDQDIRNFGYRPPLRLASETFFNILKCKPRDSIASQMEAQELFEMRYGIQKGDGSEIPIALATFKPQTNYMEDSEWSRTLYVLMKSRLHNYTGMNVMELLELPHHILMEMLNNADKISKADAPVFRQLEKDAEDLGLGKR